VPDPSHEAPWSRAYWPEKISLNMEITALKIMWSTVEDGKQSIRWTKLLICLTVSIGKVSNLIGNTNKMTVNVTKADSINRIGNST
jgi:hypothetical protein